MEFNKECIGILKEIANGYTGENVGLMKSIIFQICNIVDISIEELISSNIDFDSTDEHLEFYTTEETENKYKDYRIKKLYLKNFRTFPYSEGSVPYGISFTDDSNNPSSLFLLGGNGTGKTTIFSALEYYYSSSVSYALSRGIKKEDKENVKKFLTFGFGQIDSIKTDNVILGIEHYEDSNINEYKLDKNQNISSLAPFCSEYDFEKIIQGNGNITEFVLEQLGYSDLYKLRNRIAEIIVERKNYSAHLAHLIENQKELLTPEEIRMLMNELIHYSLPRYKFDRLNDKDIDEKINNIEAYQKMLRNLAFYTIWNQIYNNDKIARNTSADENTKTAVKNAIDENRDKIKILYQRLYALLDERQKGESNVKWLARITNQLEDELDLSKDLTFINDTDFLKKRKEDTDSKTNTLDNIRTLIDNKIKEIFDDFIKDFAPFIVETLKFFSDEKEKLELITSIGNENICKLKIHINELGGYEAYSHEYLNTFRFELFVITLKVALAINYMQRHKVILPIVIDDVLNANDFSNSIKLERLICYINKKYIDHIYHDGCDIPMQFIVFTHDEKVQHAFKKGFVKLEHLYCNATENKDYQKTGHTYIMGRLFPYGMAEKIYKETNKNRCTHCPEYFCHKCYDKLCENRNNPQFFNLYLRLN